MLANIGNKAGEEDALPVDRRPSAACAAVHDAGKAQKRSGGVGNERGMGDGELYFFYFFLNTYLTHDPLGRIDHGIVCPY